MITYSHVARFLQVECVPPSLSPSKPHMSVGGHASCTPLSYSINNDPFIEKTRVLQ